ncbi:MAG TPA: peptidylprolyl isomerase [Rugosimonospora sp.]|nr:peptidylprolyl isomerase [Rugosimonospora sp.]
MASSRDRQRKLARAKMERQMARRASKARRNRQIQAGIVAGAAVILVVLGGLWVGGVFSGKHSNSAAKASDCLWTKADTAANTNLKNTGEPPTTGIPKSGTETMTINTNLGVITASLDLTRSPCTAASFKYLAGKHFFDNTSCHRLLDTGDYVLQCGDPSGTGSGGPGYTFADEYLPTSPSAAAGSSATPTVTYQAGMLAMANSGADTNGSQFFIVYKDSPFPASYTIFGQITSGLDLVQQVGAAGDDGAYASSAGGGHPKKAVKITSMTVSSASPAGAAPSPSSSAPPASTAPSAAASSRA